MSASSGSVSTIQPISDFKVPVESNTMSKSQLIQHPSENKSSEQNIPIDNFNTESTLVPNHEKDDMTSGNLLTDISPAIAISDNEIAYFHAIRYILRSHKRLNEDDIQYASNYISSFYSHNYNIVQDSASKIPSGFDSQLIMFLVYADQNGICKFALIFNEELDNAIKNKDDITLKRIILGPKEMFVELYDNSFLSTEDRDFITRLIARESFAIMLSIELLKKKIINLEEITDTCTSESFTIQAELEKGKKGEEVTMVALTTKCYDEVCIQDAKILEDDNVRGTMSKYEKTPESVFTVDKPLSSKTPQVYCFNTLDLIAAITENTPINPKTGEPFSEYSLKIITQRFHKEIAMYRRYRQIKSNK